LERRTSRPLGQRFLRRIDEAADFAAASLVF